MSCFIKAYLYLLNLADALIQSDVKYLLLRYVRRQISVKQTADIPHCQNNLYYLS